MTFTYDSNGSLTVENRGGSVTSYTYDRGNRLAVVQTGLDDTTMSYSGETGLRRTKQWVESGSTRTTTFVWDGSDYVGEVTN